MNKVKEIQEVREVKDWHAWKMLYFFISFAAMQDEITQEMEAELTNALMRFKPLFDE